MPKHVHAEVIKAWADGAEIEILISPSIWQPCPHPTWHQNIHYRVKPTPHKWQAVIDAWTAGKKVQWWNLGHTVQAGPPDLIWHDAAPMGDGHLLMFNHDGYIWRIKPAKVEQTWYFEEDSHRCGVAHHATQPLGAKSNLKLTFEDGKLIKAEVI